MYMYSDFKIIDPLFLTELLLSIVAAKLLQHQKGDIFYIFLDAAACCLNMEAAAR